MSKKKLLFGVAGGVCTASVCSRRGGGCSASHPTPNHPQIPTSQLLSLDYRTRHGSQSGPTSAHSIATCCWKFKTDILNRLESKSYLKSSLKAAKEPTERDKSSIEKEGSFAAAIFWVQALEMGPHRISHFNFTIADIGSLKLWSCSCYYFCR
jgi:hypothetical protein